MLPKRWKCQRWSTLTRVILTNFLIAMYITRCPVSSQDDFWWDTIDLNKDDAKYRDIFPLTSSNFTKCVMDSFDPWVVLLHQGTIDADWKTAAVHMRGVVWFGMIDITEELILFHRLKFQPSQVDDGSYLARVYPFGKKQYKAKTYRDVSSPQTAVKIAVQSLPRDSMTTLKEGQILNEFLMDCILTSPARFPAIFITDPQEMFPAVFTSISIRLKKYFNFGSVASSSTSVLSDLDLGKLDLQSPALVVLASFMKERQVSYRAIVFNGYLPTTDQLDSEP